MNNDSNNLEPAQINSKTTLIDTKSDISPSITPNTSKMPVISSPQIGLEFSQLSLDSQKNLKKLIGESLQKVNNSESFELLIKELTNFSNEYNAEEILTSQDDNCNNILHAVAYHRNDKAILGLFEKYHENEKFSDFINHRNKEGTNPLGMIFLNPNPLDQTTNPVIELFINQPTFKVNEYLNNKKGIDYTSDKQLRDIGGFNILHMSLIKNLPILKLLSDRNEKMRKDDTEWSKSDNCVNFLYPTMNHQYHMNSPDKLLAKLEHKISLYEKIISFNKQYPDINITFKRDRKKELNELQKKEAEIKQILPESTANLSYTKINISNILDKYNLSVQDINVTHSEINSYQNMVDKKNALLNFVIKGLQANIKAGKVSDLMTQKVFDQMQKDLNAYQTIQIKEEDADKSGDSDSDNERETSAHIYKKTLLNFTKSSTISSTDNKHDLLNTTHKLNDQNITKLAGDGNQIDFDQLNKACTKENILSTVVEQHKKIVIPHFHGVPFMHGHYTNHQRREIAKEFFKLNPNIEATNDAANNNNVDKTLHSRTSTSSKAIENLYHLMTCTEKHTDLRNFDEKLTNDLQSDSKRKEFCKILKTYVNDFKANPIKEVWEPLIEMIKPKELDESIVKYRFPFISTSKAPDHAIKFAFGQQVETTSKGELGLMPKYDENGTPAHRLAGLLFITMHPLSEIDLMSRAGKMADTTKLQKSHVMENLDTRIKNQIESIFVAKIDQDYIKAVIPMVYPNLDFRNEDNYEPEYHESIYGLFNSTEGKDTNTQNSQYFTQAQKNFTNKESICLYDTASNINKYGKLIMPAFVKLALEISSEIAKSEHKTLCYYSPSGKIEPYSTKIREANVDHPRINTYSLVHKKIINEIMSKDEKKAIGEDEIEEEVKTQISDSNEPIKPQDYYTISKAISLGHYDNSGTYTFTGDQINYEDIV